MVALTGAVGFGEGGEKVGRSHCPASGMGVSARLHSYTNVQRWVGRGWLMPGQPMYIYFCSAYCKYSAQ